MQYNFMLNSDKVIYGRWSYAINREFLVLHLALMLFKHGFAYERILFLVCIQIVNSYWKNRLENLPLVMNITSGSFLVLHRNQVAEGKGTEDNSLNSLESLIYFPHPFLKVIAEARFNIVYLVGGGLTAGRIKHYVRLLIRKQSQIELQCSHQRNILNIKRSFWRINILITR